MGVTTGMTTDGTASKKQHGIANPNPRLTSIGIIGAGFSGLACAYELSQAGYAVDLYEARNRLGGRVHSVDRFAPGRVVEFGAELIGSNHPLWLHYAKMFRIPLDGLSDSDSPTEVIIDNHRYADDELTELESEVKKGHAEMAVDAALATWEKPWDTVEAQKYDQLSLAKRIANLKTTQRAKRAIYVEFLMDMACPPENMNYLALMCIIKAHGVDKYWSDTEVFRSHHGSQLLASYFAEGISGRLRMDCPVLEVNYGPTKCSIKVRDGRIFEYSDVVLTVPPSAWNRMQFSPALPAGFAPQMGATTKFLSVVDSAYWLPNGQTDLMTDTFIGMTWEGSEGMSGEERVLVSFAGGSIAEKLHAMPKGSQAQQIVSEFEKTIPGFGLHQIKSEFVDWLDDEWTQGGYSFPAPGKFLSQARILADGIGRLHFAGEHASFGFAGFMEGGLHAGVQAAHRLMKRDGVESPI